MRFIPTAVHGLADYLVSFCVIAAPFISGLLGSERWVFVGLGLAGIFYSLMTRYEWGLVKLIGMRVHLVLDMAFGIVMLLLPVILLLPFGLAMFSYVTGILALALVLFTRTETGRVR